MNAYVIDKLDQHTFDLGEFQDDLNVASANATTLFDVEAVTDPEKFDDLAHEWNSLLQTTAQNSVFLTVEWCSSWWKHFHHSNDSLFLIVIRHAQSRQLLGLAPLVIKHTRGVTGLISRQLSFLGHGSAAPDHLDFILHPDYSLELKREMVAYLWANRSQWDLIHFDGMQSNSRVIYGLLQQHPHLMKHVTRSICPYLTLPGSWQAYRQTLSRNMRYNLGRFQRRLKRDYPTVTAIKRHDTARALKKFMPDLFNLHTMAQRRRGNTGIFADKRMQNFHREVAHTFAEKGWLRAYSLDIGNTSIAALYCFQYNQTVYFYQSGFDLFWRRYSPGSQLMAHAIKSAIEENAATFDFLRGEEDYKFEWTKTYQTNLNFVIPFGMQKQLELIMKQTRSRIKRRVQFNKMQKFNV